jgi:hypothetical protein
MTRALALLLALAAAPLHAEPVMGRLFSTPAERAALEARRSATAGGVMPAPESSAAAPTGVPADPNAAPAAPVAPQAETLVLNGVLRSSSGRSTIWLNDQPQRAGQATYAKPARNGKGMTVTLPSGQRILLKPGQRYDLNEGKVKDVNEP